jgi:hypothetical protein
MSSMSSVTNDMTSKSLVPPVHEKSSSVGLPLERRELLSIRRPSHQ